MKEFVLGRLTPSYNDHKQLRFQLTMSEGAEGVTSKKVFSKTIETLADECIKNSKFFTISDQDDIKGYDGPLIRIFMSPVDQYVLSNPSPEDLANFLREYHNQSYD
mgnify:CR=1 FL=1